MLKRPVRYYDCPGCGYVQTQSPDWLEEAYAQAINVFDTGILVRNLTNTQRVIATLWALGKLHGRVIDHASGYGLLVRLLRDAGVDARWRDKYCENLVARGFEAGDEGGDLVTAFEVFEHMEHPLRELESLFRTAPAVLLTTDLVAGDAPPDPSWWYLGPEHGQHIGFFRLRTLRWMASQLGADVQSDGKTVHLFTRGRPTRGWRQLQRHLGLATLLTRRRLRTLTYSDIDNLRAAALRGP